MTIKDLQIKRVECGIFACLNSVIIAWWSSAKAAGCQSDEMFNLWSLGSLWQRQLGGPEVKMLACCTGGPGLDHWVENPKIFHIPSSAKSQLDVIQKRH